MREQFKLVRLLDQAGDISESPPIAPEQFIFCETSRLSNPMNSSEPWKATGHKESWKTVLVTQNSAQRGFYYVGLAHEA